MPQTAGVFWEIRVASCGGKASAHLCSSVPYFRFFFPYHQGPLPTFPRDSLDRLTRLKEELGKVGSQNLGKRVLS